MSVYTDKEVLEMLENDDEVEDWLSDDWDEEELSDLEVDDVATVLAEQPRRCVDLHHCYCFVHL